MNTKSLAASAAIFMLLGSAADAANSVAPWQIPDSFGANHGLILVDHEPGHFVCATIPGRAPNDCPPPPPPDDEFECKTIPGRAPNDCPPPPPDGKVKGNNGWGNGDQAAPGRSGPRNNAENGPLGPNNNTGKNSGNSSGKS